MKIQSENIVQSKNIKRINEDGLKAEFFEADMDVDVENIKEYIEGKIGEQ